MYVYVFSPILLDNRETVTQNGEANAWGFMVHFHKWPLRPKEKMNIWKFYIKQYFYNLGISS